MIAGSPLASDIERTVWWRDPVAELSWIDTEDWRAVFDPATGETHLLNPLPALLLQHIVQTPRNALELLEQISEGEVFTPDSTEAQKAFVALQSLHLAELIDMTGT